jgi:tRNA threonylcarbamoyladenosine biosynthesis protein TsaE
MKKIQTITLAKIPEQAANLAGKLRGGEIYSLVGPLGSGKTAFVKALAKALGIKQKVTSPTFTLLNRFELKIKNKKPIFIYHLDLYRCKSAAEAKTLGLAEFWGKPQTMTFIEWGDKIKKILPPKTKTIKFSYK